MSGQVEVTHTCLVSLVTVVVSYSDQLPESPPLSLKSGAGDLKPNPEQLSH